MKREVLIIAGPTASGKTRLSLEKAEALNGVIINCDSLQVYNDLKILTAFPSAESMRRYPHKLFGILNYDESISSVDWAKMAANEIEAAFANNQYPIIAGGTGFYIDVLVNGISPIPEVRPENREAANTLAYSDFDFLCDQLYKLDPALKTLLTKDKHHQLIRAYEVFLETGKSIREFFALPKLKFVNDVNFKVINIDRDRAELYRNIELRFDQMLSNGAISEVEALLSKIDLTDLNAIFAAYPIFKTIGSREIARYLNQIISFEKMKEESLLRSRHYAKRQITWFKNKLKL